MKDGTQITPDRNFKTCVGLAIQPSQTLDIWPYPLRWKSQLFLRDNERMRKLLYVISKAQRFDLMVVRRRAKECRRYSETSTGYGTALQSILFAIFGDRVVTHGQPKLKSQLKYHAHVNSDF